MVATSSTEAEILAMMETSDMLLFAQRLISECMQLIDPNIVTSSILYADNQPGIDAIEGRKARNKHYSIKVMYLAECLENGLFLIKKVHTSDNMADMLTKPLRAVRLRELVYGMMIGRNSTPPS
jgi:hypothetical protein